MITGPASATDRELLQQARVIRERSGHARYRLGSVEEQQATEWRAVEEEALAREVRGEEVNIGAMLAQAEQERRDLDAEAVRHRQPGWRVPDELRNSWPMYRNEAVTFTTTHGPVTVGRSLARIYDLDGWPDATVLEEMVGRQGQWQGATDGHA